MMTSTKLAALLSIALGSALVTGCAASTTDDDMQQPDDPSNPDDPTTPDDPDPTPLTANGMYKVHSTIDLASSAPGQVGVVVNAIIDATDDGDDPTSWILDQVINNMSSGTFKSFLQNAKPFVAGYLNDRLLDFAPDFVTTMVQVGDDFGQIAHKFGLSETLEVNGASSTHSVLGAHFKIDNIESDYLFADYGMQNQSIANVGVTMDQTGKLSIADHQVSLSYGSVLRIGLDAAIIPMVDSNAHNLGELFANQIDCQAVGEYVYEAISDQFGFGGSPSLYANACTAGLNAGANFIYSKITTLDSTALQLGLAGTAKGVDTNNDHVVDKFQTGAWAGTVGYGSATPAPLSGASFFGER